MLQVDTTIVYDTVAYSKLQLTTNSSKLDIPQLPRIPVLIPVEKTDTIVKENKVYVAMEREYFYTETKDAQIWHSGVDSTIDSLNVLVKNMIVSKTETVMQKLLPWGYSLDLALNYGRMGQSYIEPGIAAEISYRKIAVTAEGGINIELDNMALRNPAFYWQVGVKYNLLGR